MKLKIVWIAVICSLLVTACGTKQTQSNSKEHMTLAELEQVKTSLEKQSPEAQEVTREQPNSFPQSVPTISVIPNGNDTFGSNTTKANSTKPNTTKSETTTTSPNTANKQNPSNQSTNPNKPITEAKPVGEASKIISNSKPIQPPTSPLRASENGSNHLSWNEFFDNDLQNKPSQKFWDLQGKQVMIDGFMGEVLSFDGGWFLLIPAPGAECPFDNGDETYWNKIMIVFVKEKEGLRFTGGPLRITGRLDVGIKVDESNYKTMFRLYDATFEEIK